MASPCRGKQLHVRPTEELAVTSTRRRPTTPGKHPLTPAAGPYGHPFHPILVTVPIGAWITSLLLDIGSRVADDGEVLARAAWWAIGLGVIGALLAAVFGLLDLLTVPSDTTARRVGMVHAALNLVVAALFMASFIWRWDRGVAEETSAGQLVLSIVALVLLAASGWLGGMLTYRFGVRVAEERHQADGFR
jgi:uncharacterized membrane protein